MIIDGNAIAREVLADVAASVAKLPTPPRLTVFTCQPNFETQKFLALKKRRAEEVGISLRIVEFSAEATVPEMTLSIQAAHQVADGIIVQLPFPRHIPIDEILPAVHPSHDVDALTYDGDDIEVLPPVVGAIDEICQREQIDLAGKRVVVVGYGKLVGIPAAIYAKRRGAQVKVVTKETAHNLITDTKAADVLILGAGVPGLITRQHVTAQSIVFDAGTSEMAGKLTGDALPEVGEVAALVTPVPGGIGPITVAVLLRNTLRLATRIEKNH